MWSRCKRLWVHRFVAFALEVTLGALALCSQEKARQDEKSFRETLDVHVVDVDVVALNQDGTVVTDLTKDDFQVTDDGKKIQVQYFARPGEADGAAAAGAPATGPAAAPQPAPGAAAPGSRPRAPRQVILFVDLDSHDVPSRNRVLDEVAGQLGAVKGSMTAMVVTFGENGLHIEQPFSSSPADWAAGLAAAKEMPSRGVMRAAQRQSVLERIESVKSNERGDVDDRRHFRNELPEVIGLVREQAEKARTEAVTTLIALRTLCSALSAVPGPKSLVYVGDGIAVRPGEELFGVVADLFQGERTFEQRGGFYDEPPNPGTGPAPSQSDNAKRRAELDDAAKNVGPSMDSADSLRAEAAALDLTEDMRALTADANNQRVTLYGLSSATRSGIARASRDGRVSAATSITYDGMQSREDFLTDVAELTGGLAIGPDAQVKSFLDQVLADPTRFYSLGYVSPHGGDAKYHKIKVKVNRKGVELRHRDGYIDRTRDVRIGDVVAGALLFGSGENPHHLALEVVSQAPADKNLVEVTIGVRLPMDELQLVPVAGQHQAKLELYVQSRDGRGILAPLRVVDLTVAVPDEQMAAAKGKLYGAHVPVLLAKGAQTVAIGVVEPEAQRTSVARTVVVVTTPSGGARERAPG